MRSLILIVFITLFTANLIQAQPYQSMNISLISKWTDPNLVAEPSHQLKYGGVWGWHDGTGNEFAIVGAANGVYFVDVTNPTLPTQVGFIAGGRPDCLYHEIKTYSHYAYITSDDGPSNVFQIVDLQYLPDSIHVVLNDNSIFERVHTQWVDGDKLYCASVKGGQFINSPMVVFSLANPELPVALAKVEDDYPSLFGYVHDMYVRNDSVYASAGYDGLFIFHFNSTTNHFEYINSLTSYPSQGYNHSSALTADGNTLVFCDEVGPGLPVKVMNVSNLQVLPTPITFISNVGATPHNPFMVGNTCYIAYYQEGLQVYDVSVAANPIRIGYFDTHDQSPFGGPYTTDPYAGAWGAYPFLPSGNILVTDMQNGLFILDGTAMTGLDTKNPETNVDVFPNPIAAGENVHISLNDKHSVSVTLTDIQGKLVLFSENNTGKTEISTKGFTKGVYLLKMETDSGSIIKKLVIN